MADGSIWEVRDYAEILRVQDAEVLGSYTEDFYRGMAAVTCKHYGEGNAYYVAARTDAGRMRPLFEKMMKDARIFAQDLPEGVEYHERSGDEGTYAFYLNCTAEEKAVSGIRGKELLTGTRVDDSLILPEYGAAVVKRD